jgi:hypothetical protein
MEALKIEAQTPDEVISMLKNIRSDRPKKKPD